jgi:glycosyltransferase involved in cell wall biosynthesis
LRVLLFGSQLFTLANYALCLPRSGIDVFIAPLFSSRQKKFYEDNIELLRELQTKRVRIVPIFLNAPDASFRHFFRPFILVRDSKSIFETLKALAPDVVIGFYVLNALPLALYKGFFHYRLFVRATGGDVNLHKGWFYRIIRRFIYRQSDAVFAVSRELSKKIRSESGREPMLLSSGTDSSFFKKLGSKGGLRRKWNFPYDKPVVLTVANLVRHKGVHVLIEAVSLLHNRLPKVKARLAIVGEGPEKGHLKELTYDLGLEESVVFLGYKSRRELLELYNASDLFVLASYTEGLPAALLEAMACENLCVSTPVGDVGNVIRDSENGFLVNVGDSTTLAEKMRQVLLLSEEQKSRTRARARKTIERDFDLRKAAEKMMGVVSAHTRAAPRV